jgi:cytoskeletal protein RodZ
MENVWKNKLYNYQEQPPQDAWENIVPFLTQMPQAAKVVPFYKKSKWIISAAASLVLVLGLAVFLRINNNQPKNETVKTNTVNPTTNPSYQNNTTQTKPEPAVKTIVADKKNNEKPPVAQKEEDNNYIPVQPSNRTEEIVVAISPKAKNITRLKNRDGKYVEPDITIFDYNGSEMTITGPNGDKLQVSNKLAKVLLLSANGSQEQENLETIINESANWKHKMKTWKNNFLSNTLLTPFLSIESITDLIKENK